MAASKRNSKNRLLLTAVILVLCSCGLLGGAAFWAGNTLESRAKSLPYHLDEAQRLGMPTTIEQLVVQIKDPREDALPDLIAAREVWLGISAEDQASLMALVRRNLRGHADKGERAELAKRLADLRPMMQSLTGASDKPACSVVDVETWRDREQGPFWTFVREGVRILSGEAVRKGRDGDLAGAEKTLLDAADLTKHLTAQPSYLPMMRRCGSEIEILRAAERIAFANRKTPENAVAMLKKVSEHLDTMPSAAQVLSGELPMILDALSDSKRTGLENVPAGEFFADVGKSGSLEIWNRYYKKLPSDPYEQDEAERVLLRMDQEANDTPFYGTYVNGYFRIMPTLRDLLARRRLAETAIRYLETGELSEMPEDPHSDGLLLVKQTAKEIVLYSVGRDGRDDGGAERKMGKNVSPYYDLIFRLPVLPSKPR